MTTVAIGVLFVALELGLYFTSAYLQRKRRVPTFREVGNDLAAFNRTLELALSQRAPRASWISKTIDRAGLGASARLTHLLLAMVAAAALGWQASGAVLPGILSRLLLSIGLACLPIVLVVRRAAARDQAISAQLPQVLTTVIPALSSGHRRVEDCFAEFVRERRIDGPDGKQQRVIGPSMPGPLGPELFRLYHDIQQNAVALDVAIANSIRRVGNDGYEDLLIGILAASRSTSASSELSDLRLAIEKERSARREVASAVSMVMMEAAAVPFIGLLGLLAMRFIVPNAASYLSQPAAQVILIFAWLLGAANIIRGKHIASLGYMLRRIEI